ncbi:RDD family protein [Streptomyces abikoensis]|uniref:RDD family protein n=1 Tax=Streptomyces abikoensis TaxID=97398 RepID=UPI0036A60383
MSSYRQPPPYGYGTYQPQPYPPPILTRPGPPAEALPNPAVRLGARIIDILIILVGGGAIAIAVGMAMMALTENDNASAATMATAFFGGMALYEPLMTHAYGGTFGKSICGLRVARVADGQNLSLGAAFGRWAVYQVSSFVPGGGLVNTLSCLWDKPLRRCFHDRAASSVVVKRRWGIAPNHP